MGLFIFGVNILFLKVEIFNPVSSEARLKAETPSSLSAMEFVPSSAASTEGMFFVLLVFYDGSGKC